MRSFAAVALLALVSIAAAAGCSSLEPKLDANKIASAIQTSARSQFAGYHALVGAAHCPAGRVQKKGADFDCTVTIDHQKATYVVHQVDGHGTVQPSLQSSYLLFTTINNQTLDDLRSQGLDDVTVACGFAHVWFVKPPVNRTCIITLPDHTTRTAKVSIAADGGVDSVTVAGL